MLESEGRKSQGQRNSRVGRGRSGATPGGSTSAGMSAGAEAIDETIDGTDDLDPRAPKPSPRWWAPAMVALMVIGLIIVVMTYLSRGTLPVNGWGNGNLVLGFAVMMIGFLMTTRWR